MVFDHLPKAGGSQIKGALIQAFGELPSSYSTLASQKHIGEPLPSELVMHEGQPFPAKIVNHTRWFLISEFHSVNQIPNRTQHFIIGSIREPCSYYISAWAFHSKYSPFKSTNPIVHKQHLKEHGLYYNGTAPYDRKEDLQYFEKWMFEVALNYNQKFLVFDKPVEGLGMLSSRVLQSYKTKDKPFNTNQIDCWVYTHRLHSDLNKCFLMFMKRGGVMPHYARYAKSLQATVKKVNPTSHTSCSFYYSNSTLAQLVSKVDHLTYSAFNMSKCCEFE